MLSACNVQCAREQMGIRANGNLVPKFIASYSRANGNSSKWECSQKNHAEWLKMGTFLVKWDSFEHSNAPKHQNGKPISLQVIREQMGIRANGNIPEISCNWSLNGIPFARERTVYLVITRFSEFCWLCLGGTIVTPHTTPPPPTPQTQSFFSPLRGSFNNWSVQKG